MAYTYNGILLCLKKEWNSDTCYMNEPRKIMLSEINHTQKDKYYTSLLMWDT